MNQTTYEIKTTWTPQAYGENWCVTLRPTEDARHYDMSLEVNNFGRVLALGRDGAKWSVTATDSTLDRHQVIVLNNNDDDRMFLLPSDLHSRIARDLINELETAA